MAQARAALQTDLTSIEKAVIRSPINGLGVVTAGFDSARDVESIVSRCDRQLYGAKESGRKRVCGLDLSDG